MKSSILYSVGLILLFGLLFVGCQQLDPRLGPWPSNKFYVVQPGFSLWRIAQRFNTTVDALVALNGVSPEALRVGQQLLLPPGAEDQYRFALEPWELDLFARLVHAEAEGEPYEGKVAVAASVLNRLADPRYPDTIYEVIYQVVAGAYQYSPVRDGRIDLPAGPDSVNAVHEALLGRDPSLGANGFYNPQKTNNQWVRQQPVTVVIGQHVFFRH